MSLRNFKSVGDSLNTAEFNGIVSLARKYTKHNDNVRFDKRTVVGEYGTYILGINNVTFVDTGIMVSSETITGGITVKLTNPYFKNSVYTVSFKVLHRTGVNVLDDIPEYEYEIVDYITVDLIEDTIVNVPTSILEEGYVLAYDSLVEIKHSLPVRQGSWINNIEFSSDKSIIQSGETANIICSLTDLDNIPIVNQEVLFYEQYTDGVKLKIDKKIIQSGETVNLTAQLIDSEDGSLVREKNVEILFYIEKGD